MGDFNEIYIFKFDFGYRLKNKECLKWLFDKCLFIKNKEMVQRRRLCFKTQFDENF